MASAPPHDPRDLAEIDPFDPAVLEHPFDYYARLHREAPVFRHPKTGIYFVSSHALVSEALSQPEVFSNRFGPALGGRAAARAEVREIMAEGWPPVDTMLTADPPEQRRFRSLVNKAFTLRRVRSLAPRVEALCDELIDAFLPDGRVELRGAFAVPLPLTIISEQLGVPRAELPLFKRWSDGFVAQLGGMATPEQEIEAARLILEFQRYFAKTLEDRRASPQDDIISDLVHARVEGERPLDTAESLSILQQLLVAGNETTASTISEGMWLLVTHPEQLHQVAANLELVPNLVEEVLRLASPTANMWRVVRRDTELGGVAIPGGSIAVVRFAAANRDPAVFPEPERFDVERPNADEHLAFGHGIHHCLGAQLARCELQTALRKLIERLPDPRLAPNATLRHTPHVLLRGLEALPLVFG
ncbi:MAG: cytochrome P450 [Myxococcota bacterium]|nr:cytochrome P450 [Myxococcota bacterium]